MRLPRWPLAAQLSARRDAFAVCPPQYLCAPTGRSEAATLEQLTRRGIARATDDWQRVAATEGASLALDDLACPQAEDDHRRTAHLLWRSPVPGVCKRK